MIQSCWVAAPDQDRAESELAVYRTVDLLVWMSLLACGLGCMQGGYGQLDSQKGSRNPRCRMKMTRS